MLPKQMPGAVSPCPHRWYRRETPHLKFQDGRIMLIRWNRFPGTSQA